MNGNYWVFFNFWIQQLSITYIIKTGSDEMIHLLGKVNSLYQVSSKMLHSTKIIILVGKKRKEVAWLGFELTTFMLEVKCTNPYTMYPL